MTIVHIINNLEKGGAETQLTKLVCNDYINKHIIINLIGNNSFENILMNKGIVVVKFNFKSKNPLTLIKNFFSIYKTIKHYKPKVIICWLYHSFLFSFPVKFLFKHIKIYWNIRQVIPDFEHEKISTKLVFYVCKLFSSLPDGLIFNSMESLKIHKLNNFQNTFTKFIPNGFEFDHKLNEYRDLIFEKKIKNKKVVSLIARYHSSKGHLIFFNAALNIIKKNKEVVFLIAGKNVLNRSKFSELIKLHDCHDFFSIYDELTNVDYYLNKTNLLVNCSLSSEGFPNIIGEAIINNCFCITSGIGDAKKIFNNDNFFIFKNNAQMLEEKINNILNTEEDYLESLRKKLKKDFESKYNIENTINEYNKLYI